MATKFCWKVINLASELSLEGPLGHTRNTSTLLPKLFLSPFYPEIPTPSITTYTTPNSQALSP